MHFSKSSRYALLAAMEMAVHDRPVTIGQVAARHGIPPGALAHALQGLVRAGIAEGLRGVGGGYALAKSAKSISVLDVITVFDPPPRAAQEPAADGGHAPGRVLDGRLRALFAEVDATARSTFASVSLATLTRGLVPVGS